MTQQNERTRTIQRILDEHAARRKALGPKRKRPSSLRAQLPSLNPISRWFSDRGINMADVRRE